MKKIFSFVIVAAAVAMVSCGGNASKKVADAEAVETVTETSVVVECDSTACDSTKNCAVAECDSTKNCPAAEACGNK